MRVEESRGSRLPVNVQDDRSVLWGAHISSLHGISISPTTNKFYGLYLA